MKKNFLMVLTAGLTLALLASSGCVKKNPPRDEIPIIKDFLARLEISVKAKNAAAIDSLIIADALEQGYSSTRILDEVYREPDTSFYTFGQREFFYTKDRAVVTCKIMAVENCIGRPLEMTLIKVGDRWLLKKFDLK